MTRSFAFHRRVMRRRSQTAARDISCARHGCSVVASVLRRYVKRSLVAAVSLASRFLVRWDIRSRGREPAGDSVRRLATLLSLAHPDLRARRGTGQRRLGILRKRTHATPPGYRILCTLDEQPWPLYRQTHHRVRIHSALLVSRVIDCAHREIASMLSLCPE